MRHFASTLTIFALGFAPIGSQAQIPTIYVEHISCTDGSFRLRLPQNLPDVMKLGIVEKEKIDKIEKWDGYTTTHKTVFFRDLSLGLITNSNDSKRYMVSHVEITGKKWEHIAPFRIGESIQSVRGKLGRAAAEDPSLMAKYSGDTDEISFRHAAGKITKITYGCYTG